MNFSIFIRDYSRHGRVGSEAERTWHADQPSLRQAIEVAALAINHRGKRHSHQRRIRHEAIAASKQALLAAKPRIRAARSFDALLTTVTHALHGIPYIGELYCYDTAFRIGAFLHLLPDRVYLHAGVREGARALGLKHNASFLPMSALPPALRTLPAHEVEDFLCIYRDGIIRATGCGASPRPCQGPRNIARRTARGCH